MQEWFQHPAAVGSQEGNLAPMVSSLPPGDEVVDLPQRHSFGFGVVDHEDHTSSDGEPGLFLLSTF